MFQSGLCRALQGTTVQREASTIRRYRPDGTLLEEEDRVRWSVTVGEGGQEMVEDGREEGEDGPEAVEEGGDGGGGGQEVARRE